MSELVVSYHDWLQEPLNEGRPYNEYIEEVCVVKSSSEIIDGEIIKLEEMYLEFKDSPQKRELIKVLLEDLRETKTLL